MPNQGYNPNQLNQAEHYQSDVYQNHQQQPGINYQQLNNQQLNNQNQDEYDFNMFRQSSGHHSGQHSGHHRHHRKKRKAKKIALAIVIIVAIVAILGGVMVAQAFALKDQAKSAMKDVQAIQTDMSGQDYGKLSADAKSLAKTASEMNGTLSNPLWAVAGAIPVIGDDVTCVRTLADVLDTASSKVLVPVSEELQSNPPDKILAGEKINTAALKPYVEILFNASNALSSSADKLKNMPDPHMGQIADVVNPVKDKAESLCNAMTTVERLMPLATEALDGKDHTYLLVAQNSAEIRSTGGFPGSMGVLVFKNGEMEFGGFSKMADSINFAMPSTVSITPEENSIYGVDIHTISSADSGYNPDFERVGYFWAESYKERNNGATVDGVISATPVIVQDILAITGPVTLSDGEVLDGTNAVKVLQYDIYWRYVAADRTAESTKYSDDLFSEAAELTYQALTTKLNPDSATRVIAAFNKAFDERTLMIWMSNPSKQAQVKELGISGGLEENVENPKLGTYFSCIDASRMGLYTDMSTVISDGEKNPDGTTTYKVVTTIKNTADKEDIPKGGGYIMGPNEDGDLGPYLYLYAPIEGKIDNLNADINGKEVQFSEGTHKKHQVRYISGIEQYPGEVLTVKYEVVVSSAAKSKLGLVSTPTLTKYLS